MKNLKGKKLNEFPFGDFYKIGDLVNYEGPFLSLFSNNKGELYLYHWVEKDEYFNRWLVFQITLSQLKKYLNKNLTHFQLISKYFTDYILMIDLDNKLKPHNMQLLTVKDIPADYLPDKDVYHSDEEALHLDKIQAFIIDLTAQEKTCLIVAWKQKFKIETSLSYENVFMGSKRISNREQIIAVG